jgi:sialate O-acetylesterase
MKKFIFVFILLIIASFASAEVRLPSIFGDNMILQRQGKAAVWGWANPGEKVKVSPSWGWFGFYNQKTTADENGRWKVYIKTGKAKGPQKLTIKGEKNTVELSNILLGEVWLCSGQSNMAWTVSTSDNAEDEIAAADYPQIRLFTVQREISRQPLDDCSGEWKLCSPKTAADFSAVGYFFGRKLHTELDVPVGLINSSWGGTVAEAWICRDALAEGGFESIFDRQRAHEENFEKTYEQYLKNLEEWTAKAEKAKEEGKSEPRKPVEPIEFHQNSPCALYNAMINPLVPFTLKGAIWYQGESNRNRAFEYKSLFPTLINNWRDVFDNGKMPFYFVQLASYRYGAGDRPLYLAELREAQLLTLKSVPYTGMAVTTDISDINDIHPTNKQDVGKRLALWALARDYGKKIPYSGPIYDKMEIEDGRIRIHFRHTADGLVAKDGPLEWFEIAGLDGEFVEADAVIDDDTVIVSSPDVTEPAHVRFGYHELAEPNLFNSAGLPASPFRTDSLPWLTEPE